MGRDAARDAFEAAMLDFHRFSGQVDVNLYVMRLNDRFAGELAEGRIIDPNPLAAD